MLNPHDLENASSVIAGNNLLEGSKLQLSVDQFCGVLLSNIGDYLASKWDRLKLAKCKHIKGIENFDDRLLEIVAIDSQANEDLKRVSEMAAESIAK